MVCVLGPYHVGQACCSYEGWEKSDMVKLAGDEGVREPSTSMYSWCLVVALGFAAILCIRHVQRC